MYEVNTTAQDCCGLQVLWKVPRPALENAAADEVDDLQPVTILQRRAGPLLAAHDVAVQFHRDPVRLHSELLEKRR